MLCRLVIGFEIESNPRFGVGSKENYYPALAMAVLTRRVEHHANSRKQLALVVLHGTEGRGEVER